RFNEWLAKPAAGSDWFELFNTTNLPVDLSVISLSDDPSLIGQGMFRPAPLSFIGANGFVQWLADNSPGSGHNHVNFKLNALGDSLLLYAVDSGTNYTLVDSVSFGAQAADISVGRFPDGDANLIAFPGTASPGYANYLPLTNVVINEALAHTDPPLEDAIELHNPSASPVSILGWFLSNEAVPARKCQLTNAAPIPAGGYVVIYESQFNDGGSNAFTLNSAHGDAVWLTATTNGVETGARASVSFGASFNGVSFGRYIKSTGDSDFPAMAARTFGSDTPASLAEFRTGTGRTNTAPRVGPLVISEIHYQPPPTVVSGITNDNTLGEFIELTSLTNAVLPLYDPAYPTNRWRLSGAIDFTFPTNSSLAATGSLLVVSFDPKSNLTQLASFRTNYGVATNVPVFGPYLGKLGNVSDTLRLEKPDAVQLAPHPDAGFVPFVLIEQVAYEITNGWPADAAGTGKSLQRVRLNAYANDPANWHTATPTPGRLFTPLLTITAPTEGQRWSNFVFTVRGTARENIAGLSVAQVYCQINDGAWNAAATTNGWTNWMATISLLPGTNTVQAYAQDSAGNDSATGSVKLFCVVTNRLTVVTNGRGNVS
ncbi:MAG: lamin tail domain-containing protein, partial [Verrucomicrobia bacterium]|nr:lamin tail domain-containing protein [Verrucomicrobiota bacterium]